MGTFVVGLVVAGLAALAVKKLVKDKRSGKGSCGGDCGNCNRCR